MRTEIRYTLLIVLFEIVRLFTEYYLGLQDSRIEYSWISSFALIAFIIWAVYWAVDDNLDNSSTKERPYLQGAKTGFFVLLFSGALMALVHYLFFTYKHPEYFSILIEHGQGMGLDLKQLEATYTLPNHLRLFIFYPSYGLVLGSISSWFISRKH